MLGEATEKVELIMVTFQVGSGKCCHFRGRLWQLSLVLVRRGRIAANVAIQATFSVDSARMRL